MTVIIVVCLAAVVAILFACLHHIRQLETAYALERRELLTRIQKPEYVPTSPSTSFVFPEQEPDEINLVGAIEYSEADDG